jgi:hypothetical protein
MKAEEVDFFIISMAGGTGNHGGLRKIHPAGSGKEVNRALLEVL